MRMIGNKIECYRGESFILQVPLVRRDGVPFYVKSNAKNPYLRLTVKSNTYTIGGQYKKSYWVDISGVDTYDAVEQFPNNVVPTTLGSLDEHTIYYIITTGGREYYVYKNNAWVIYKFLYTKQFLNEDTKNWPCQNMTYEISYVDGVRMQQWLFSVYASLYNEDSTMYPTSNIGLAMAICKKDPYILKDVDVTAPLASYTINEVVLAPAKLIVKER